RHHSRERRSDQTHSGHSTNRHGDSERKHFPAVGAVSSNGNSRQLTWRSRRVTKAILERRSISIRTRAYNWLGPGPPTFSGATSWPCSARSGNRETSASLI